MYRKLLAVLASTLLSACATLPADVCLDPRLPKNPQALECASRVFPYLEGDAASKVQLVRLYHGQVLAIDYFVPKYSYFLRTPGNELRQLVVFPPWPDDSPFISFAVLHSLEINSMLTGVLPDVDPSLFYEVWIARFADNHCVVYRMRPPFVGEVRDCASAADSLNTVGYGASVWTWKTAMRTVCERVANDSGGKCDGGDVKPVFNLLKRDLRGNLYYVVAIERSLPGRPALAKTPYFLYARADYLVYRVSAADGKMTLLDHQDKVPNTRYWQKQ